MKWIVYILEYSDNSLYTGITNDMERRLAEHRTGRVAKYTKHRRPLKVRYTEYQTNKSAALKREAAIKSLDREEKLTLIALSPQQNCAAIPLTRSLSNIAVRDEAKELRHDRTRCQDA